MRPPRDPAVQICPWSSLLGCHLLEVTQAFSLRSTDSHKWFIYSTAEAPLCQGDGRGILPVQPKAGVWHNFGGSSAPCCELQSALPPATTDRARGWIRNCTASPPRILHPGISCLFKSNMHIILYLSITPACPLPVCVCVWVFSPLCFWPWKRSVSLLFWLWFGAAVRCRPGAVRFYWKAPAVTRKPQTSVTRQLPPTWVVKGLALH